MQTLTATGLTLNNPTALSQLFYADDEHADELAERIKTLPAPELSSDKEEAEAHAQPEPSDSAEE